MGASSWSRKVAYQADIAAALRQAREDAYRAGDCYRSDPSPGARTMSEDEFAAASVAEMREGFRDAFGADAGDPDDGFAREEWRAAQIDVVDADTLLASQPFSGTHS